MSTAAANWHYPTAIRFGAGRIRELPEALATLGIHHPLLVTDEGLVALDIVHKTMAMLSAEGVSAGLYANVQSNPTGENVEQGVAAYRAGNHDGVIAFGGGSALDAGKCIALLAEQQRPLWDFEDGDDCPGLADARPPAPVVAVPTTAGTGSEVGRAAVILDQQAQCKKIIFHPQMLPDLVISDPELTIGLPPNITAWTGIDAMVHAIEAYCAPSFHPMAEGIAVECVRMVARWLPEAVADGANLEARGQMLVAASMGATAFQKGLGSVHSVSHVLGALYDTHHGLANAVVLPFGLTQNMNACEEKLTHLATVLALPSPSASGFVDYIFELREQLGIPNSLSALGIDDRRAQEIGELAFADPCTATNARPVQARDLQQLFTAALEGDCTSL